jgi:diaminohydroxyphosphoribosylaminopyrimidine deaminase/5-amino-6-(5-phosphoribosylamino)uracil reductase
MALQQAGERAKGGTMYIGLEPCCHYGRTPPCTEAIIDAGISKVHVAALDPNPLVSGKGVQKLTEVGVEVVVGEYEEKAKEINEGYFKYITTGFPFVIAKFAMSLDGKISTRDGDSRWISGDDSRNYVHQLRHIVDAVMVGANTIIADNPKLSARGCFGKGGKTKLQPVRVIVDGKGRTPSFSRIFEEPGETLIVVAKSIDNKKAKDLIKSGAEIVELAAENDMIDLGELMAVLGKRQITSVLVEGGSQLFGSLFDCGLVDKVLAFVAPIIIGGENAKSAVGGIGVNKVVDALHLHNVKMKTFEDDVLVSGYLGGK